MTRTLSWLHLSDFHFGKARYEQIKLCKEINTYVHHLKEQGKSPDLIFITGDLANSGSASEYEAFNEKFLYNLLDTMGNDFLDRILTIPGNHDVNRNFADDLDTHTIPETLPHYLYTETEHLSKRKHLLERFQDFVTNDWTDAPDRHWLNSSQGHYSQIFEIGEKQVQVGVLCINTAWFSQNNYDERMLDPGEYMLTEGLEKISQAEIKIVLGHHPLSWLRENKVEIVKTLLGKYGVIYLHGHLHKNSMDYTFAGDFLLTFQAGAAYLTKDDPTNRNRILRCELDLETNNIYAEPLLWSEDYREWVTDSEAFRPKFKDGDRSVWKFPLPKKEDVFPGESISENPFDPKLFPGWISIDPEFLASHRKTLSDNQIISFFNGRPEPSWTEILSGKIPQREQVDKIFQLLTQLSDSDLRRVIAVLGAGGEGKSTIIRQVVCELVQKTSGWRILWHENPDKPLPVSEIHKLPGARNARWLIVSDYASSIVNEVRGCLDSIKDRKDIFFLLSSRLADWRAENGDRISWGQKLYPVTVRGLNLKDADMIVRAWKDTGGLEELASVTEDQRAQRLFDYAKEESGETEGAFLGAMLRARRGQGFDKFVRDLLAKLKDIRVRESSEVNLLDIFSYIVYMHIDGFDFLSKDVLAEIFGFKLEEVRKKIINPLGDEALITTLGKFDRCVQTRHRAIANTAEAFLSSEFGFDRFEIYSGLLQAARQVWRDFRMSDTDMQKWSELPFHFFDRGERDLSFHLVKTMRDMATERTNPVYVVDHAHLYRKSKQYTDSVRVFREAPQHILRDRVFFTEWGIAERLAGNHYLSVWLLSIALADGISLGKDKEVTSQRAEISLRALANSLREANEPDLRTMLTSTEYLLNQMKGTTGYSLETAINDFINGLAIAYDRREADLPSYIPEASSLKFISLSRSLKSGNRTANG